jgi:2-oxoglutarate ferredoxin oxidoreductase subunit gamma
MYNEIIIAGFGGQGVLLSGTILAQAAMMQGLHTTWFPSYGAEMRGGTANSTVIISSDEIGAPTATLATAFAALNEPSFDKFIKTISKSALVVANSSLIPKKETLPSMKTIWIPASDIAGNELGNIKAANIVVLGALAKVLGAPSLENVLSALSVAFKAKPKLIEINQAAAKTGWDYIK